MVCVFRRLLPFPIKLVSNSSHCLVMREPLHVRLVEIILKGSYYITGDEWG